MSILNSRVPLHPLASAASLVLALAALCGCNGGPTVDDATTTSGAVGAGGSTGIASGCTPGWISLAVDDTCGLFVSAATGDDSNPGTKAAPYATLGNAIGNAHGKPVYACNDPEKPFVDALIVDEPAVVFGALDCTTWVYAPGTKTSWTAPAGDVPLRVRTGATVRLEDISLEAADAAKPGASSIAVVAEPGSSVELQYCNVTSGDGKEGTTPDAPSGTGKFGAAGSPGLAGCADVSGKLGGDGGQGMCNETPVSGGPGGNGTKVSSGGPGGDGIPSGTVGKGGTGQSFDGLPDTACTDGADGADGLPGTSGLGAGNKGMLSLDGFAGEAGQDGQSPGKPSQGGGGGGGARKCSNGTAGPSAAGGGAGGCGGVAGKGGYPGGASIAIVSLNATLTFFGATVTAKKGGQGGSGGLGQPGGGGGAGGTPGAGDATSAACSGGKGGKGGRGGRGGGGSGGPSIGIAYTGTAPVIDGEGYSTVAVGTPGDGGFGDGDMGAGAKGLAAKLQAF